jgi:hypothetical protein
MFINLIGSRILIASKLKEARLYLEDLIICSLVLIYSMLIAFNLKAPISVPIFVFTIIAYKFLKQLACKDGLEEHWRVRDGIVVLAHHIFLFFMIREDTKYLFLGSFAMYICMAGSKLVQQRRLHSECGNSNLLEV